MNNLNNKRFLFGMLLKGVLSALLIISASAQPSNSNKASTVQFSCVTWDKLEIGNLFYRAGTEITPLKLKPGNRSVLYPLKSKEALELYIKDEEVEEGEVGYKLVAKALIPKNSGRILFFLSKKKSDEKLPLFMYGIDDGLEGFPPGSFRFLNGTKKVLNLVFDKQKARIAPSKMTVVKLEPSATGGLIPLYIKTSNGEKLYENRLHSIARGRDMVFIYPPRRKGARPRIKFLPQIIPPQSSGK